MKLALLLTFCMDNQFCKITFINNKVGLPYQPPHKFRHGHAVYSLKQTKDIPALKAVNQNLMQSNLSNTDGVYEILSDLDVSEQIALLGKNVANDQIVSNEQLLARLKQ